MAYKKLIDNERVSLADTLREIAPAYKHLSIATGYWDLSGTLEIIDHVKEYESIRLLIGQEPLSHRLQTALKLDPETPENLFPDADFIHDLEEAGRMKTGIVERVEQLRSTAALLARLMKAGTLEVKVFRTPRLHAKTYIFGTFDTVDAVGIVGSSNFTKAGLVDNRELNSLEENSRIVQFDPRTPEQEYGHLSWYEKYWNDPEAVEWTGDFSEILQNSPMGDLTFGPYDVYIKTLMEVFPDELIPPQDLGKDTQDVLYSFQDRNAGILLNKLNKMGVAMLSDSVGLGKTVTAGAVIKHYRDSGKNRLVVIAPAALVQQWKDDLGTHFGLIEGIDFKVISLQNLSAIESLIGDSEMPWMLPVSLFVIDEAHNLRSRGSRYEAIERLFEVNPDSHVLLLTATPINNSLMDFASQIQLGSKGSLSSVSVPYMNRDGNVEYLDFFVALKRIQSEVRQAERNGSPFAWNLYREVLGAGLRHYLVRSTRQGVEAEGGIISTDGTKRSFPTSIVEQIEYQYEDAVLQQVYDHIRNSSQDVFEGLNPCLLNINAAAEITQQTSHPLDFLKLSIDKPEYLSEQFGSAADGLSSLFLDQEIKSVIPNVFQAINFMGFTPYRPKMYNYRYHAKSISDIRDLGLPPEEKRKLQVQLVVHNILHVTWLKRQESSAASLLKSVEYYKKRLALFEKYLNQGFIVSLADANTLEKEYEADIDQAFDDYDKYLREVEAALADDSNADEITKQGVERIPADGKVYNLEAMRKDLERDKKIVELLITVLSLLSEPEKNAKLRRFAEYIEGVVTDGSYGHKVLVFSFFSDTINYLQDNLSKLITSIPNFTERAGFVTGSSLQGAESIARRFAPNAKKRPLKEGESELDFLFATDVLSEGQNLQDAGILINYDLHWNPVRMIQRNGRINRLGSEYKQVLIANARPHSDLELYLRLVRRLERKIDTIKNSIGTDQSILGEEENPIEFIDYFSSDHAKASAAAEAAFGAAEGETDALNYEDEFLFELRRFLAAHDDNEVERVLNMPAGKWNYLPAKIVRQGNTEGVAGQATHLLQPEVCFALEKVAGKISTTGQPINETIFVKIDTIGRYPASVVENSEALALIRTIPEDNERQRDTINVDRQTVVRRAATQARVKAESVEASYDIKPKQLAALTIMASYISSEIDLQGTVRTGIRNARQEHEFKRLVGLINREQKERGSVFATTISRFEKLINELFLQQSEGREIEHTEGILYYHSRN
jgi:ERCC4-related helicase